MHFERFFFVLIPIPSKKNHSSDHACHQNSLKDPAWFSSGNGTTQKVTSLWHLWIYHLNI